MLYEWVSNNVEFQIINIGFMLILSMIKNQIDMITLISHHDHKHDLAMRLCVRTVCFWI